MYTEIIYKENGKQETWLVTLENFELAHPKAIIVKVIKNETDS